MLIDCLTWQEVVFPPEGQCGAVVCWLFSQHLQLQYKLCFGERYVAFITLPHSLNWHWSASIRPAATVGRPRAAAGLTGQTSSSSCCASVCVEIIVCVYIRISSMSTFSPRGHPDSNDPVALLFKFVIFSRWGFLSSCVKNDSFVLQVLPSVRISACFVHVLWQKIDIVGCILLF